MRGADKFILALFTVAVLMALAALYDVTIEMSQKDQYRKCVALYPEVHTDLEVEAVDMYCRAVTDYRVRAR
jgi:hypothetical protein